MSIMALEILTMDLSSTVIGSAVSCVVVIISYVIYRIGICSEKSFEEVIEEQKKRSKEEELKQKSEKGKKEKKFKKTWGKKSKDRTDSEMLPESVQVIETKDVETDFEIIEPRETKLAKQKNKSKSAESNQKSVDVSVQAKVRKADASPVSEKPAADKKKADAEKKKADVEKINTNPKVEVLKQIEVKEVVPPPPVVAPQVSSSLPPVSHKKKKKEPVEKDIIPMTANKLLSLIKESELEAEEIQNLIDILLNKQKDSSGWTKKNDHLAIARKNLHEKEQLLEQEQKQTQAVTSKLKEVRESFNTLKSQYSALEKSSLEKIKQLQQDCQILTTRAKQVQDQVIAEKEKISQIEKENENLKEEKMKLLQNISKLETESRSGISKTEYEAVKKAGEELQNVHTLLVDQHTQLVSKEKNTLAQLSDLNIQIEKLNSQNRALTEECMSLKETVATANLAEDAFKDKLMAAERNSADLEIKVKQISSQSADIMKLQSELSDLKLENERLAEQLVTTKERVAGDGQEILHQNGEFNGKSQEIPEKIFDQKDKLLEEKEFLLVQLNDDLNKQKAKMTLLTEEIEVQKQKNNELREKNWKAMEALTDAEKNAEQRIKEIQLAADQKLKQLEKDVQNQSLSKDGETSLIVTEKLKQVESELAHKLEEYNKEIEQNKQLSYEIVNLNERHKSATDALYKTLEESKTNLGKCQSETKEYFQQICPSVSVDSSLPFKQWLLEFGKQVASIIHASPSTNSEELFEKKEKEYIEKQKHYEQVLKETESTLLYLQKNAESQENLWQRKLKLKDQELEQIKLERNALTTEKEAMQSTFQQMSQLEELQEKLKLLQSTLESAESERSHLGLKYEEVNKNCLNLRDQLENKEKQILELQKSSNSLDSLNREIEDLRLKLEKEKKISKDFSSQMIRLNSLVKIGQDALTSEQEMVKKLKAQLEAAQVSTANGTSTATIASSVTVSESQKKIKNPEKSKKKMGRHKMTGCFG